MDLSSAVAAPSYRKAVDAYKKAVATAATVTAYAVLARGVARELVPVELRDAVTWAAELVRGRLEPRRPERRTAIIKRHGESHYDNSFYRDAHAYLATKIDPRTMSRFVLSGGGGGDRKALSMEPGDSMTDVFEGVEFSWKSIVGEGRHAEEWLELSFDADHTDMALDRYVPFITAEVEQARQRNRALKIYMNECSSWHGISHHHPATFDTIAMDLALKQTVVADLDRFLKRKEYYRRIGKAWKRGYLLYGPPGTGKSSLVAAMANYLRFNLYDLDLSSVTFNNTLQKLLISMSNRSILVIEDIDCCFSAKTREDGKERKSKTSAQILAQINTEEEEDDDELEDPDFDPECTDDDSSSDSSSVGARKDAQGVTLSALLNFIDGLWSTSGEERIIIFTTNYKDRLDPALLRPGRMDMHVYMGYCGWEAFKTLARNYFAIDDHPVFPEIRELMETVEVTPAEVSEMLLRSEDADIALQGLREFLEEKK